MEFALYYLEVPVLFMVGCLLSGSGGVVSAAHATRLKSLDREGGCVRGCSAVRLFDLCAREIVSITCKAIKTLLFIRINMSRVTISPTEARHL